MKISLLKRQIILLVIGMTLIAYGLFGATVEPEYLTYTDEEIKEMASDLGMVEMKEVIDKDDE